MLPIHVGQYTSAIESMEIYNIHTYNIPRAQMTSTFEGQSSKTRPKCQSKQGPSEGVATESSSSTRIFQMLCGAMWSDRIH